MKGPIKVKKKGEIATLEEVKSAGVGSSLFENHFILTELADLMNCSKTTPEIKKEVMFYYKNVLSLGGSPSSSPAHGA